MQEKLLGYYNYTVILTYAGMITGFLGIVCVMENNIHAGLICLMIAGLCDMFDDAIASTKLRTPDEKCFGIQIESLSDLICFGVLPALITIKINAGNGFSYAFGSLFVLCALIRLAYFNVSEQNRQKIFNCRRTEYYGLPVTTVAITFPLLLLLCDKINLNHGIISCLFLLLTGILFLMPFPIKKPKIWDWKLSGK